MQKLKMIKSISRVICLVLALTHFAGHANDRICSPASFEELPRAGKLFVFEVATTCQLNVLAEGNLLAHYKAGIERRKNVTVLSANDIANSSERQESALSIVEELVTEHGEMTIYGNINIVSSTKRRLGYTHRSGKITATGAAANTRLVVESVNVSQQQTTFQIALSKVLHINKPWYAPTGIFRKEVGKGLKKDMGVIIDRHLSILSGK